MGQGPGIDRFGHVPPGGGGMTMGSDYGHIEQFLGEGWDEDMDLSGTLFGCIPRGKLERFHIHVYRVAWMAELNVSAVDDLLR